MAQSPPKKTLSQAEIARLAGVSPMTVSLAMRNHTSISLATRNRIHKIAKEKGYVPDPLIGKLMQQLRIGRHRRTNISLCSIREKPANAKADYIDMVNLGARRSANDLGYFFEEIFIEDYKGNPSGLQGMLWNRGVEGLILSPLQHPADISHLVDWSRFVVISASVSVIGPDAHRVIPNHFGNTLDLGMKLNERGLHRLGLIISRDVDERSGHRFDAAIQWLNHENGVHDLETLRWDGNLPQREELRQWIQANRPDVIISEASGYLDSFLSAAPELKSIPLAVTTILNTNGSYPGILEDPLAVGAGAVELLSSLFQHGQRGLPAQRRSTMIAGTYWEPEGYFDRFKKAKPRTRKKSGSSR